jgi:PhoH-like ATPase
MLICDDEGFEAIIRHHDEREAEVETCASYRNGRNLWGINARDTHQNFAMNLLMDETIDLVSLAGAAGTGKTFIVMAAALSLVFDERAFERVVITRETTPMGEEIGFRIPRADALNELHAGANLHRYAADYRRGAESHPPTGQKPSHPGGT